MNIRFGMYDSVGRYLPKLPQGTYDAVGRHIGGRTVATNAHDSHGRLRDVNPSTRAYDDKGKPLDPQKEDYDPGS